GSTDGAGAGEVVALEVPGGGAVPAASAGIKGTAGVAAPGAVPPRDRLVGGRGAPAPAGGASAAGAGATKEAAAGGTAAAIAETLPLSGARAPWCCAAESPASSECSLGGDCGSAASGEARAGA